MNYKKEGSGIFFLGVIIVCFLCGCVKKAPKKTEKEQNFDVMRSELIDRIIEQEALLVNIPLPLYDERILSESFLVDDPSCLFLGYKSPLSLAQAQSFFLDQMERYGWRHLVSFEADELLMQFENPHAYCTIKVVPLGEQRSSIFIYVKRGSEQ